MLEKLFTISRGMTHRFPEGNDPFQMLARLLEESGELAQQVNHFEGTGIKRQKYGEPDRQKLAQEVMQVLRCAAQFAIYYGIEEEVETQFEHSYQRLKSEGHLLEH
jgi:NTP pyrophosphatase (non-canonical NTP hydrolase)